MILLLLRSILLLALAATTPFTLAQAKAPDYTPAAEGRGSIIVIVATDAPLLPGQCDRLAQRAALGVARCGGAGEHSSGDLMLAFATGNRGLRRLADPALDDPAPVGLRATPAVAMDGLFYAVIEATEEAIVNAMVAAPITTGRDGITAHAIPHDRLTALVAGRP